MAHISRRELKKDEVRETFAHGAEAVLSHQQLAIYIVIAAIVVAGGFYGWKTYTERQTVKASALFDDAMKDFQARETAPGEQAQPGETTYSDEKTKYSDAAKNFAGVTAQYPRTHSGELGKYYEALSLEHLDKSDDAKKLLQSVGDSTNEEFASLARLELAGLDDRTNQSTEAGNLYQQLLAKPTTLVPKPVVLLALAEYYAQKDPSQAAKYFGQIKSDYPGTPIATQAEQELALLSDKS